MKKLQNNFTTPEQSKWLLRLGVPADSADCYTTTNNGRAVVLNLLFSEFMKNIVAGGFNNPDAFLPCWSVGRLIEICLKCSTLEQRQVRFLCEGDDDEYSLIDYAVTVLESSIMTNQIDFSKLED